MRAVLVFLQNLGWCVLVFVLAFCVVWASYRIIMIRFGYKWSIKRLRDYLSDHGRGNFADENTYVAGRDILTRLICVVLYGLLMLIIGILIVSTRAQMAGIILACGIFMILGVKLEMGLMVRIGRLTGVDADTHEASFVTLNNEKFSFVYKSDDTPDRLVENRKYYVMDYGAFVIFGPIDAYEWR